MASDLLRLDVVLPSGRGEQLESSESSSVGELRTLVTWIGLGGCEIAMGNTGDVPQFFNKG